MRYDSTIQDFFAQFDHRQSKIIVFWYERVGYWVSFPIKQPSELVPEFVTAAGNDSLHDYSGGFVNFITSNWFHCLDVKDKTEALTWAIECDEGKVYFGAGTQRVVTNKWINNEIFLFSMLGDGEAGLFVVIKV